MEDIVSRLVVLAFSVWFYCLRIHVDLYVPVCTVLLSGPRFVFYQAPPPVWGCDREGSIGNCNPTVREVLYVVS